LKSLNDWLAAYAVCHKNPSNILIHKICVPLIMFSLLGMLWCIPTPSFLDSSWPINFSSLFAFACLVFYFFLDLKMFLGMLVFCFVMMTGVYYIDQTGTLLVTSITIFVLSWIGQFWGHKIEGKKPSFFEDLTFLLIGPLWVLHSFYRVIGIRQ